MPVTVVVGGQYGSEGKGKVSHFLARSTCASAAIRIGGPNSGHTIIDQYGKTRIFRHLPTAAILPDVICVLAAGNYIDPDILQVEVGEVGLPKNRLIIDPRAMVISSRHRELEAQHHFRDRIGSTGVGVGAAVINRIERMPDVVFAKDHPILAPYVADCLSVLRPLLQRRERIIIEGTQGYGLSLLHSPHYPFVTSRDTSAAGFVSEAGLSPLDVDTVAMVIRSFPIRVPGPSGPLDNEITWDIVQHESGSKHSIEEWTSVTKAIRRVGRFSPDIVRRSIEANAPNLLFLNHIDHVDIDCSNRFPISVRAQTFVEFVERSIGAPINFVGTSPAKTLSRSKFNNDRISA